MSLLAVVRKAAVGFEEARVARRPAGSPQGGQFAPKGGGGDAASLGVRLAEIMGTQELAEHSTVGAAMQAALGYLHDDRDFDGAEDLVSLFGQHLEARGRSTDAADRLREVVGGWREEAEPLAPDLPDWAAPVAGVPDGEALVREALSLYPVTEAPIVASSWLLPDGRFLNMVAPDTGASGHHDDVQEAFEAAGQATDNGVGYSERFALRTGALRVFLPDETATGPTSWRAHITRIDAGRPMTEAQGAALRRLLRDAEHVSIERQVVQAGGRPELGEAWLADVRAEGEDAKRAVGRGVRLLMEDCREGEGTRAPSPVMPGGAVRERRLRDIRKAVR